MRAPIRTSRVAANTARLDGVVTAQATRIAELEHFAADHTAGAIERQREVDQLRAEQARLEWQNRYGRRR